MKTYKQASKTPPGGWVKADFENMQAVAAEEIGRKLCLNPEYVYNYGMKRNIKLGDKFFDICQDLEKPNLYETPTIDFIGNVINYGYIS